MIGQKTRDNCIVNAMSLPFLWSVCNHVGSIRFLKLRASFFSWTTLTSVFSPEPSDKYLDVVRTHIFSNI